MTRSILGAIIIILILGITALIIRRPPRGRHNEIVHINFGQNSQDFSKKIDIDFSISIEALFPDTISPLATLWKAANLVYYEQACLSLQFGLQGLTMPPAEIGHMLHLDEEDVLLFQAHGLKKLQDASQQLHLTYATCFASKNHVPDIGSPHEEEGAKKSEQCEDCDDDLDCVPKFSPWADGCGEETIYPLCKIPLLRL